MKRTLDKIDAAILEELQQDARLSNKELAAKVNLAPSSCLERVRRLRSEAVLRGFHAEVDPGALGIGLESLVYVRFKQHGREVARSFTEHADSLPEVIARYHISGEYDFLLHVAVRDVTHLRNFTLDSITGRDEVSQIRTSLIFEHAQGFQLPHYED